jgi:Ca2+-binding EF-hand superfamily protein
MLAGLLQAQEFGRGPGGRGRGPGRGGDVSYIRSLPILIAIDANHDGIISAEEIANSPAAIRTLDRNGDGQLTPDELMPMQRERERQEPDGSEEMVQMWMSFDKNHDGKISKDELPERMQGLFERADANKDGFLTPEEIRAVAKAQAAAANPPEPIRLDPISAALDTNHDNVLSAAEINNAPAVLKTLDKNSDGQLTDDELRPARGPGGGRGNPDEMLTRLFTQFDKNGDGKISRDEAAGGPLEEMFDRADQNKDGFLTRDEVRAAMQQRGGPNGPPERR